MLLQDEDKMMNLDSDNVQIVDRLSYLGDVLIVEGGAQEAVTSTIRSVWKKVKEVSNVIRGKSIPLKVRDTLIQKLREKCFN